MLRFGKIVFVLSLFCASGAWARDINLDEIYIKKSSDYLKKLAADKLDTYQKVGATFVCRDVIFAQWISGSELLYIREIPASDCNIFYRYHLRKRTSIEICRVYGFITIARMSASSRYLAAKRIVQKNGIIPEGEMIILDVRTGTISVNRSLSPFLDFSFSPDGNSLIFEKAEGIVEYFPQSGFTRVLLRKPGYSDILISKGPSIAWQSPDKTKMLVVNGSGGNYKGMIFSGGKQFPIEGISSSSEIFWLNNQRIVFRKGYAGNYSVIDYNINKKQGIPILKQSFNTNIFFSGHSDIISFLREQIIYLYSITDSRMTNTGLEGEDISFAPGGSMFISLIYKKLFVVNINTVNRRRIELKRSWKSILASYMNLKDQKQEFDNEYSAYYINRKIRVYSDLMDI